MCGLSVRDSHACPAAAPQAGAEAEPGVRTWVCTGAPLSPAPAPRACGLGGSAPPALPQLPPSARRRRGRGSHRDTPGPRLRPPSVPGPASAADQTSRSACLALNLPSSPQICVSSVMSHRPVLEAGRAPTGPWGQAGRPPARSAHRSPPVGPRAAGGFPHRGLAPPTAGRTSGRNESGRAPHFVCPPRETLPVAGALQTEPRGTKTPRNAEKAPQTHGPLGRR